MAEALGQVEATLAGRYAIERELGRGGMAVVYLARDMRLGRPVAIKRILPELASEIAKERFLQEIQIAARLNHPHVLALYEAGEAADGALFYVMPHVGGESLGRRIERERHLTVDAAVRIARQVASGLQYAHERDVVHRDIKPENILLADGSEGAHACIADFGLALALYRAGSERRTGSGVSLGTPLYMSPEQAAGGRDVVDARSDIYSLGCVLFEMLAGVPPFMGATPQQVMMQHMTAPPPPLTQLRPECPPQIAAAVAHALAKLPADRYQTAREFLEALERPTTPILGVERVAQKPDWRRKFIIAGAVLTVATAAAAAAVVIQQRAPLDERRVAVVPFAPDASALSRSADGAQAAQRLRDALARWRGLQLVDVDEIAGEHDVESLADVRPARLSGPARKANVGRLVLGTVGRDGDTLVVTARLYDVRAGRDLTAKTERYVGETPGAAAEAFQKLGSALLRGPDRDPLWRAPDDRRVIALDAALAYDRGRDALRRWDLAAAERHLRAAVATDAELAQAQLWLAQLLSWRDDTTSVASWLQHARRAVALGGTLSPADSVRAVALLDLAERRYPAACARYAELARVEGRSFGALFGLGECQRLDGVVVPDGRATHGYRFRTSTHAAMESYVAAIDALSGAPPEFPYDRLWQLIHIESGRLRAVTSEDGRLRPDFRAYLALDNDTLVFVPVRVDSGGGAAVARRLPPSWAAAADYKRRRLRDVFDRWTRLAPDNLVARERFALVLESLGVISAPGGGPGPQTALSETRAARQLARDSVQRVRLAQAEVQLLVKAGEYGAAVALADSLLKAWPAPPREIAARLAGLAALTGQRERLATLLMRSGPDGRYAPQTITGRTIPLPSASLAEDAARSFGDAALGVCDGRLRDYVRRVDQTLPNYYPDAARRDTVRHALLDRTVSLAVPCVGPEAALTLGPSRDMLVGVQQALATGGPRALVAGLDSVRNARRYVRPGDVAIDYTFHEAWLLVGAGDSAAALEHLRRSLDAPETLSMSLLHQVPQAAGFVRALRLRGELAAAAGDSATARSYADAVAALWTHADSKLGAQPALPRTGRP